MGPIEEDEKRKATNCKPPPPGPLKERHNSHWR
jgi:hypothetical protein